jgi:glycosyltransferase involved in cell wall biosynthesis
MAEAKSRLTTTVVVVTRDRPRLLDGLLESLVHQTVAPDEVLVVDNDSAESYDEVFGKYESKLPLRAVVEKEPGIPRARNRGIREAKGEIVLFTDDDCRVDRAWLENMVRPFYRNPHIGIVGGEIDSVGSAGGIVEEFCIAETLMRMGREEAAE